MDSPNPVVITGHSRTGKTALLYGALDERFAVVVPNGSGCGGATAYRRYGPECETIELITRPSRFAAWFSNDFRQFADKNVQRWRRFFSFTCANTGYLSLLWGLRAAVWNNSFAEGC